MLLRVVLQVAPPKGGGKGASAKKNFKRDWPEASASWDRATPAAPAQAAKGGGKRAKGSGKKELTCFHCLEKGHWTGNCPKKAAGQPAVARPAATAPAA